MHSLQSARVAHLWQQSPCLIWQGSFGVGISCRLKTTPWLEIRDEVKWSRHLSRQAFHSGQQSLRSRRRLLWLCTCRDEHNPHDTFDMREREAFSFSSSRLFAIPSKARIQLWTQKEVTWPSCNGSSEVPAIPEPFKAAGRLSFPLHRALALFLFLSWLNRRQRWRWRWMAQWIVVIIRPTEGVVTCTQWVSNELSGHAEFAGFVAW